MTTIEYKGIEIEVGIYYSCGGPGYPNDPEVDGVEVVGVDAEEFAAHFGIPPTDRLVDIIVEANGNAIDAQAIDAHLSELGDDYPDCDDGDDYYDDHDVYGGGYIGGDSDLGDEW